VLKAHSALNLGPLEKGPIARFVVYPVSGHETMLVWEIDHLVFDGASGNVLRREILDALIDPPGRLRAPDAAASLDTFGEFAQLQREWLRSKEAQDSSLYWRSALRGAHASPRAFGHQMIPDNAAPRSSRRFVSDLYVAKIQRFAGQFYMTENMYWLMCWATAVAILADEDDILVQGSYSNREDEIFAETIGWFSHGTATRINTDLGRSIAKYVEDARDSAIGTLEHARVPFLEILKHAWPDRFAGRSNTRKIYFGFVDSRGSSSSGPMEQDVMSEVGIPIVDVHPGLHLWVTAKVSGYSLYVACDGGFPEDMARRASACVCALAARIAETDPETSMLQVGLDGAAEDFPEGVGYGEPAQA
jgi:hypothetical protein